MRKILFIALLLYLFQFQSIAQSPHIDSKVFDNLTTGFIEELHDFNIDTICVFKKYCIGGIREWSENSSCASSDNFALTYILWIYNKKTYLHKKCNCFNYKTIEIGVQPFWCTFFKYREKINNEKIEIFEYEKDGDRFMKIANHSCFRSFSFFIKNEKTEMIFDVMDLQEEDESEKNINYEHNINLKGNLLINELDELIKCFEKNNLWMRKD